MRKLILIAAIASALVFQSSFFTESMVAQTKSAPLPAVPSTINVPVVATKEPPAQPQQPSSPVTSLPDVSPLALKEILSANNQVVGQVASMYKSFGILITIIVTVVGIFAGVLGFYATRSVRDFLQDWKERMESLEKSTKSSLESWNKEMKDSLDKVHEAAAEAQESANKAAEHAQSIEDSKKVFTEALQEGDRLRAAAAGEEEPTIEPTRPGTEGGEGQLPTEPLTAAEDAEVSAHLQGKINPEEGEG